MSLGDVWYNGEAVEKISPDGLFAAYSSVLPYQIGARALGVCGLNNRRAFAQAANTLRITVEYYVFLYDIILIGGAEAAVVRLTSTLVLCHVCLVLCLRFSGPIAKPRKGR